MRMSKKKEIVPKFRFPEFQRDGIDFVHGNKLFKSITNTIPFIRSAEINKSSTELFITEEGFKNSSAKMVKKGDILIALYGANSGEVALSKIDGGVSE